jgi:hypothetical protein
VNGVLVGAVVLLAVLTLMNIALLLAVVRRLREHETRFATLGSGTGQPEIVAPIGQHVEDFTAESVDGQPVDRLGLRAPALVGFFSPSCDSCHERIPDFRKAAGDHPGSVLAVVVRDGRDPAPLVAELDEAATVVVEEPEGPVSTAFSVRGFPAFALIEADGTVGASGYELPLHAS